MVGSSQRDNMSTYSLLKYKGLLAAGFARGSQIESLAIAAGFAKGDEIETLAVGAGFAKATDVTVSINAKAVETKRLIIGQLDREITGGNSTTTIFLDTIIGGNATTTSFAAEYDGGSANG